MIRIVSLVGSSVVEQITPVCEWSLSEAYLPLTFPDENVQPTMAVLGHPFNKNCWATLSISQHL